MGKPPKGKGRGKAATATTPAAQVPTSSLLSAPSVLSVVCHLPIACSLLSAHLPDCSLVMNSLMPPSTLIMNSLMLL
jgi:hypothetical protein